MPSVRRRARRWIARRFARLASATAIWRAAGRNSSGMMAPTSGLTPGSRKRISETLELASVSRARRASVLTEAAFDAAILEGNWRSTAGAVERSPPAPGCETDRSLRKSRALPPGLARHLNRYNTHPHDSYAYLPAKLARELNACEEASISERRQPDEKQARRHSGKNHAAPFRRKADLLLILSLLADFPRLRTSRLVLGTLPLLQELIN